jgi:hypothetical protein
MTHLQRSVATLRISGDDLIPSQISTVLGAEATFSRLKGQAIVSSSGKISTAKMGQWHLSATDREPENLDAQVAELLGKITTDLLVWKDLCKRYKIDLFCGWFMRESNEGVEISPATLTPLGDRGIVLGLDIYGPESDT